MDKNVLRGAFGVESTAAALTTKQRNSLPKTSFALPATRQYPIQDIGHARNALARSAGKPEEAQVKQAVYARWPQLKT